MPIPNNMTRIVGEIAKLGDATGKYDAVTRGSKQVARQLVRETILIPTVAALANGTTDTVANAATAFYAHANGRVLDCKFLPQGASAENATNYVKIELHRLTGAGGSGTAIATSDTRPVANSGTGSIAQATPYQLTLDAPNANFTRGQLLAPSIDQVASGVAVAAGTLVIRIELEDVDNFGV